MKGILCIKFDLFKIKNTDFWAAYGIINIICLCPIVHKQAKKKFPPLTEFFPASRSLFLCVLKKSSFNFAGIICQTILQCISLKRHKESDCRCKWLQVTSLFFFIIYLQIEYFSHIFCKYSQKLNISHNFYKMVFSRLIILISASYVLWRN